MARIIPLYPNKPFKRLPEPAISPELGLLREMLLKDMGHLLQKALATTNLPKMRKWLTEAQVQQKLNITPGALRQIQEEGGLPYAIIAGEWYFDPADIDRELRKRKQSTPQGA